jgi:Leucine-rich repeat (LRR) protein
LDSLEELDLSGNYDLRTNEVIRILGKLPRLKKLIISNLGITELPKEISGLKQLKELDLSSNRVRILPAEIGNLDSLKNIVLSDNDIINLPSEIALLSRLSDINLHRNKNLDLKSIFSILSKSKSKNLGDLILSECAITVIPEEIGELSNLGNKSFYVINLSKNFITDLPHSMEKIPRTLVLLASNPIPEEIKQWFFKSQERKTR